MAEYINKVDIIKLINGSMLDLSDSDDLNVMLTEVEELPTVTINDLADEIKVTNCNHNADDSKKVSSSCGHENDLIHREDALNCFHDWIDQRGDVHTADEMPEYQQIEQLPSAQPEIIWCKDCKFAINADTDMMCDNPKSWVVATENDFGCILAERRTDDKTNKS